MCVNKLILGDNLDILRSMESESVDLIYLDPPFFSNKDYEVIWGDEGEIRSFRDRWEGGISHYIAWLKERVAEMHRILKPTGSIFLHCDWHADAYIRVEILDRLFGMNNFRGDIVWQRTNAHNDAKKKLAVLSDTIWYYSKTDKFTYNPIYAQLSEAYKSSFYKFEDERGAWQSGDLTGSGTRSGESGQEWRGYNPTNSNRHWAIPVKPIEDIVGKAKASRLTSVEKLELLLENNYIEFTSNGTPRYKRYLDISKGILVGNIWTDIQNVQSQSKERIGYPTQKPMALLERIIQCASNESDTVLDPFVGGGTTVAVADKLNRKWIGIDQSVQAIKVTEFRLQRQTDLFTSIYSNSYTLQLHKYDYDTLRHVDAFEFESWIVQQFGGTGNAKQRGDKGIDGKMSDGTPIQVKRSENVGRSTIDKFPTAAKRYDADLFDKNAANGKPVGYIIAFSFGRGAVEEVARLKLKENILIELVTVDKIVPVSKKPNVTVEVNELSRNANGERDIEFIASGRSDAGIQFYGWDFDYDESRGFKPLVIRDLEGRQRRTLKAGYYNIAVKAVDNDGLENVETIKLKVNGVMERT